MNEVFRREKKFLITLDEYYRFGGRLAEVMAQDVNNGNEGYVIRSLYFDTLEDQDFYEKEDGVEVRRKIRLRIYDPDSPFAMLEMKQKQGDQQKKRSLRVDREDAIALTHGDYGPLLRYKDSFAAECFAVMTSRCYRPKAVVEYNRKAFVARENKIRVTFDHHIRATESCFDIFDRHLLMAPAMDPYLVVLEVKFNGFLLSYIKDMLLACDRSELSVSKYYIGRGLTKLLMG